jgi:hypothetical protein
LEGRRLTWTSERAGKTGARRANWPAEAAPSNRRSGRSGRSFQRRRPGKPGARTQGRKNWGSEREGVETTARLTRKREERQEQENASTPVLSASAFYF